METFEGGRIRRSCTRVPGFWYLVSGIFYTGIQTETLPGLHVKSAQPSASVWMESPTWPKASRNFREHIAVRIRFTPAPPLLITTARPPGFSALPDRVQPIVFA